MGDILDALLPSGPFREPEREPEIVTFGPCCGPSERELEAEAGG
jgi:hypothetical protein